VVPANADNILKQWINVNGLEGGVSHEEGIAGHRRRVWTDTGGNVLIEAILIGGMAHGVPIAWQSGAPRGGVPGPFFLVVGVSSTHHLARLWGLADEPASALAPAASAASKGVKRRTDLIYALSPQGTNLAPELARSAAPTVVLVPARAPPDPNAVIAAAFEAAGLPPPNLSDRSSGPVGRIGPGPIIEAALTAAGLIKGRRHEG
jgi:hypothetical protein